MKYYLDSLFFLNSFLYFLLPFPFHHIRKQDNYRSRTMEYQLEGAVAQIPLQREMMLPSTVNPASHGVLTSFLENGIPALDSCGQ